MPEPLQTTEPVAPIGNEDAELQAAFPDAFPKEDAPVEVAPEPAAEPVTEPVANPDFTFATLENGEREMRLATGQVYRGKDDAALFDQLGKAQIAASRRITELSANQPAPVAPTAEPAIDPTALAIADLMAPAFGLKTGKELVEAFAQQQQTAHTTQEYLETQRSNMEAANFFRNVPEFSKSQADADKIDGFLQENQMPFTAKTAEMAYYTLKAKGELSAPVAPARAAAPRNTMPAPPVGTAPANTGKGAPTENDLWNMTTAQLEELISSQLTQ